jgi:diguanylate cyclase (GGDEF)-like protein
VAVDRATSTPRRPAHRAWLERLTAYLTLVGGFTLSGIAWGLPLDAPAPLHLPLWLIILLAVGAEMTVVHLEHTRGHSFSLREIPLAMGLFYATSSNLIVGTIIGGALVATLHRGQRGTSLVFAIGRTSLQVGIAIVVFGSILAGAEPFSTQGWLAVLGAMLASVALPTMLAGIAPSGSRATLRQRFSLLALSLTAASLNTSLAIVMITILWTSPSLWWVAVVPPAVLLTAYRTSIIHRIERQRLEKLYEASSLLHKSPQVEDALTAAAEQAQSMFGVTDVEIVVVGENGDLFHTLRTADGLVHRLEPVPREAATGTFHRALDNPTPMLLRAAPGLFTDSPEVGAGMTAPLFDEDRLAGVVLVANRINQAAGFSVADTRLLLAFSQHLGVSIENGRLEDSLAELTHLKEKLRHQASHDALTGLANRTLFAERVEEALTAARQSQLMLGVLFLDLDDFKDVNDGLGHAAGDELLRRVSRRLEESVRPGDVVARFGGDEFAVLLENVTEPAAAIAIADRIKSALGAPFDLDGDTVTVGASIGVALGTGRDDPNYLMRHADTAMYAAKRQAKGRVRVFEARMHEAISTRLSMQSDLAAAIEDQQLSVAYQPIIDLITGRINAFEALVRWIHPERGLIEPSGFIPFAEENGLIVPLGEWVLERAVERSATWRGAHPGLDLRVAANLSPRQLTEGDVAAYLEATLARHGAAADGLTIEITENTVMQAPIAAVEEIRELGVSLAIDDFGTGYSSLSYLDRLPIDILKIDRSFVARIGTGTESPLVRTILQIGNSLGLTTIVEGVETRLQLDRLRALRAGSGQGFYLAPPMEATAIDHLLARTGGQVLRPLPDTVHHLRDVTDEIAG